MAGQPPDPFPLSLSSAALVIVDMQNDFVRVGAPLEVPDARATIIPLKAVTRLFREAARPVIYTRFVTGTRETLLWTWSPQIRPPVCCCRIGFRRRYEDIGAERECMAVIDELAVEPGDRVVDKYGYGAFFRTNLHDILLSEGVDTACPLARAEDFHRTVSPSDEQLSSLARGRRIGSIETHRFCPAFGCSMAASFDTRSSSPPSSLFS